MSRRALVDRALAVLEEAQGQTAIAPVKPGPGLRLAVAFLYAVSDDRAFPGQTPREAFEAFLMAVGDDRTTDMPEKDGRGRAATGLALLNHIRRRVGHG
ncbi:hypothetical protein [Sphingomonas sp. 1P08PE]|uniref:hypothetical protein n=1 Tax=Sphingomonas sp. 1P08PE TaxID=554122 RepID=UPI0039A0A1EA